MSVKRLVALAVGLALAGLLLLLLIPLSIVMMFGASLDAAAADTTCAPTVIDTSNLKVEDLQSDQLANAGVIYSVAHTIPELAGHENQAATVGIATALQESTLHNINYGDRDSIGLFQQRDAWGTREQRLDPAQSAKMFFTGGHGGQRGLRDFDGIKNPGPWYSWPLWRAAQSVQVSAFPTAYAKWEPLATKLVTRLAGQPVTGGGGCSDTGIGNCPPASAHPNYPNGQIPVTALCELKSAPGKYLRGDAAYAFEQMSLAYTKAFKVPIAVTDAYRDLATQERLYREKGPGWAAVPGTSNHGWATAVDLGGGINTFGTAQRTWMVRNAPKFGWTSPAWAQPGQPTPEPWHWEFTGRSPSKQEAPHD